jgi:hypothetical protein
MPWRRFLRSAPLLSFVPLCLCGESSFSSTIRAASETDLEVRISAARFDLMTICVRDISPEMVGNIRE